MGTRRLASQLLSPPPAWDLPLLVTLGPSALPPGPTLFRCQLQSPSRRPSQVPRGHSTRSAEAAHPWGRPRPWRQEGHSGCWWGLHFLSRLPAQHPTQTWVSTRGCLKAPHRDSLFGVDIQGNTASCHRGPRAVLPQTPDLTPPTGGWTAGGMPVPEGVFRVSLPPTRAPLFLQKPCASVGDAVPSVCGAGRQTRSAQQPRSGKWRPRSSAGLPALSCCETSPDSSPGRRPEQHGGHPPLPGKLQTASLLPREVSPHRRPPPRRLRPPLPSPTQLAAQLGRGLQIWAGRSSTSMSGKWHDVLG